MNGRFSNLSIPTEFPPHYSEEDRASVVKIFEFLENPDNIAEGWNQTQLGKRAAVNLGTLNTILQAKYASPPTKWLKACLEVIDLSKVRRASNATDTPYVETSVHRAVWAACKRASVYKSFAVVSAFVGTGKTRALREYQAQYSNVVMIEAVPGLAAWGLLDMLVEELRAEVPKSRGATAGTRDNMLKGVIKALSGTDTLLIIDEAETLTESSLEYVRRIRDKAKVGVVLAGTERLFPLVRDPRGRFGQISSRVVFWPPVIKSIEREDSDALATAALANDDVTITPEVLDAFWQVCDGSARVLCEAIIPGVRDYGLRKKLALTPELIFKVGQEVLGFGKRRA